MSATLSPFSRIWPVHAYIVSCDSSNAARTIFRVVHTEFSPAAIGSVLWIGVVLCALLDFHRIVDDQVHELVEAADLALDAHAQLLVEPDLHGAVLLQELEDEVDWRQEDLVATSSLAVRHVVKFWWVLRGIESGCDSGCVW